MLLYPPCEDAQQSVRTAYDEEEVTSDDNNLSARDDDGDSGDDEGLCGVRNDHAVDPIFYEEHLLVDLIVLKDDAEEEDIPEAQLCDGEYTQGTVVHKIPKIHHRLGVVSKMISGKSYLHCSCGHVCLVEDHWQESMAEVAPGFIDQTIACPHKLYRRSNSFKKMNKHLRLCMTSTWGQRAVDKDVPRFFWRTYNNKPIG